MGEWETPDFGVRIEGGEVVHGSAFRVHRPRDRVSAFVPTNRDYGGRVEHPASSKE